MNNSVLTGYKVYVAGHGGLAGLAIMWRLEHEGYSSILARTHAELDLTDQDAVARFFSDERPEYVSLASEGAEKGNGFRQG